MCILLHCNITNQIQFLLMNYSNAEKEFLNFLEK